MTGLRSTVRSRELGRRLLSVQKAAGLNGLQLAEKLGWTQTMVSRIMSGHRPTKMIEVVTLLGLCGVVTGPERDRLLELSLPHQDQSGLYLPPDDQWRVYLEHARDARRLVEFQPSIVPWMVQTAEYTRAVLSENQIEPSELESMIASRRAGIRLVRCPQVELFVHEWALKTPLGDALLMSEQLHYLLRMSVTPSLVVRVVLAGDGVYAGAFGPFTLLESEHWSPVLYREDCVGGRLLDARDSINSSLAIIRRFDKVALDEKRSRDLIGQIAVEVYGQDGGFQVGEACR